MIYAGAQYANNAFLRCCFQKADNRNTSDSYPKLELNWSQYTEKKGLSNTALSGAITGFFNNTITAHFRQHHKASVKPTCLLTSSKAKQIVESNPSSLNLARYAQFYYEDGGQDPIDVDSHDFNGELEKLDECKYYTDYNYFERTPKKKKGRRSSVPKEEIKKKKKKKKKKKSRR